MFDITWLQVLTHAIAFAFGIAAAFGIAWFVFWIGPHEDGPR